MYICPTCGREFQTENKIAKHFLSCWKEQNPFHQSKEAPRGHDITTRSVSNDILDFFNSFQMED